MPSTAADLAETVAPSTEQSHDEYKRFHDRRTKANRQKSYSNFRKKHIEDTRTLSDREFPMAEIFCSTCAWTEEIRINSGMNIGRRLASKNHFRYAQSTRKMRNKTCPICKGTKGIRKIIWGMPAGEPDESKYYIGGCVSEDFSANYKCIDCGWEGK